MGGAAAAPAAFPLSPWPATEQNQKVSLNELERAPAGERAGVWASCGRGSWLLAVTAPTTAPADLTPPANILHLL